MCLLPAPGVPTELRVISVTHALLRLSLKPPALCERHGRLRQLLLQYRYADRTNLSLIGTLLTVAGSALVKYKLLRDAGRCTGHIYAIKSRGIFTLQNED